MANHFTFICNKSLEEGVFPDEMKCARLVPLFKSGAKDKFTNYRPVSLLPQFTKIFAEKSDNFTTKYNLIIIVSMDFALTVPHQWHYLN